MKKNEKNTEIQTLFFQKFVFSPNSSKNVKHIESNNSGLKYKGLMNSAANKPHMCICIYAYMVLGS